MIEEYVEGLPIPLTSISFTSIASENLLGGDVVFSSDKTSSHIICDCSSILGKLSEAILSFLVRACSYAAVYPLNTVTFPLALNNDFPLDISTLVRIYCAGCI